MSNQSRVVADLYGLSQYDTVTVRKIAKEDEMLTLKKVSADFVTVTIKDQFISRGDMQLFQRSLNGRWIYEGQRLRHTKQVGLTIHSTIDHDTNLEIGY